MIFWSLDVAQVPSSMQCHFLACLINLLCILRKRENVLPVTC